MIFYHALNIQIHTLTSTYTLCLDVINLKQLHYFGSKRNINKHFKHVNQGACTVQSRQGSDSIMAGNSSIGEQSLEEQIHAWKNLDFFCLDNSIRETTVGQIAGHTLENKQAIYQHIKSCGYKDIIVASFNSITCVDDDFVKWLKDNEDEGTFDQFVSFSEITVGPTYDKNGKLTGRHNTGHQDEDLPHGMKKNREYGLLHTFFEHNFADDNIKWNTEWTIEDECSLLENRIKWVTDEINKPLGKPGRHFLNIRDFPTVMSKHPDRMLNIIKYLAQMPDEYRLFGICYEDPLGESLPQQLSKWTKMIRDEMNKNGWQNGKLLNHIHAKWGYEVASTMACLASGSDGMWAGVCDEGGAVGHCPTTTAMLNLIRHGNTKIQEKYPNFEKNGRNAAIQVTKLTTGYDPHPKQIIYGERATDLVFGSLGVGDFDVAKFFGYTAPNRITTIATNEMIVQQLKDYFGDNEQFTNKLAQQMRLQMVEDLRNGVKNEYESQYGLAMLFNRAGGKITEEMQEILNKIESNNQLHNHIKTDIKTIWDNLAITKGEGSNIVADDSENSVLSFDRFYRGFMQPFFDSFHCQVTKDALKCIDFDRDNAIEWKEFSVYLDWALREYGDKIGSASQCVQIAFENGIIPAMRDGMVTNKLMDGHEINPCNFHQHTATVIFLHGVGGSDEPGGDADDWFGKFNAHGVHKIFPHIRFVFPDAKQLSISSKQGKKYQAWFDVTLNPDCIDTQDTSCDSVNDVMKSIHKLIYKEIQKFEIPSNRILICGFNQGSMVALKAALEMNELFAGVVCWSGLLADGKNSPFDALFNVNETTFKKTQKDKMEIHWFDNKYCKFYDHLDNGYSKRSFEYLQNSYQFHNAFYHQTDDLNNLLDCVGKLLPQELDEKNQQQYTDNYKHIIS